MMGGAIVRPRQYAPILEFLRDWPIAFAFMSGYQLLDQGAADSLPDLIADVIGSA